MNTSVEMMKLKVDKLDQYWSHFYFKAYIYNVYMCTLIDTTYKIKMSMYKLYTQYNWYLCNEQGIFSVTLTCRKFRFFVNTFFHVKNDIPTH